MNRLFVAISLPENILDEIQNLRFSLPNAHWPDRSQHHLTLRFIGEVNGGEFREIREVLSQVRLPSFELTLQGVGAFHSQRKARVLWVGVAKNLLLIRLRQKIERILVESGLGPERRKFSPHITLARLHNTPLSKVGTFIEYFNLYKSHPFLVSEFHLYSSHLGSKEASYQMEATYPLLMKEKEEEKNE